MLLRQPVAENAIHRKGHQPFTHTLGEVLDEKATRSIADAFVRHDLEQLRKRLREK